MLSPLLQMLESQWNVSAEHTVPNKVHTYWQVVGLVLQIYGPWGETLEPLFHSPQLPSECPTMMTKAHCPIATSFSFPSCSRPATVMTLAGRSSFWGNNDFAHVLVKNKHVCLWDIMDHRWKQHLPRGSLPNTNSRDSWNLVKQALSPVKDHLQFHSHTLPHTLSTVPGTQWSFIRSWPSEALHWHLCDSYNKNSSANQRRVWRKRELNKMFNLQQSIAHLDSRDVHVFLSLS